MSTKAKEYTVSQLSVDLRMDVRKLSRMLEGLPHHREKGTYKFYWLRDVFDHMLRGGSDALDAQQENARLAEARRIKLEIETKILNGELVYLADVQNLWANHITNCKTRLRGIPHKFTHRIMAEATHAGALRLLESGIDEALHELAGHGASELRRGVGGHSSEHSAALVCQ